MTAADVHNKLPVLIVDDEEPARALMREYLAPHTELQIVGEAGNGLAAVSMVASLHPTLVFLDVQMPNLDGFEALELFDHETAVVFTTAYDEYALRAFEVNAVDYLLKPFSRQRFEEALRRARERMERGETVVAVDLAAARRAPGTYTERIVVRDGAKVDILSVDELDYVRGQGDYIELYGRGRSLLKQQTLLSIEQSLDPKDFVRIHRSYLLNRERLARIQPTATGGKVAVLRDGRTLPISRSGEARLRQILGDR